ncbi:MAG: universal stress protein [Cytophagales bacterium]|nr:universal stress protein [Cytophagales bacterium]
MEIRTILFPTDFSDVAANALDYAGSWAGRLDAELILLHVNSNLYGSPAAEAGSIPLDTVNTRLVNAKLESLLQDVTTRFGVRTRTHIEDGQPGDVIPRVARDTNTDLIVMGSAGASGYTQLFGTNLTTKVMAETRDPILIIPQEADYEPLRNWAYASDLQGREELLVDALLHLAGQLEAHVELLHVQKDPEVTKSKGYILDNLRQRHGGANLSYQLLPGTHVLQEIDHYVEQKQPDMLVMVRHDHSFWDRLFNRDKVAYSATRTNFPMLVLHAQGELGAGTEYVQPAGRV